MDPSAKAKKRKIPSVPNEERLKDAKHRYTHHPGDERRQETGAPALGGASGSPKPSFADRYYQTRTSDP